jgi:hypothetical protein
MLKALKVTMYVIGVVGILFGLAYIFIPEQLGETFGFETSKSVGYLPYFLAAYGGLFIVGSVYLVIAARDPLRHILWVKFAITWALVSLALDAYSIILGNVTFSEAMGGMIIGAVFAAALLVFYPYKAVKEGQ